MRHFASLSELQLEALFYQPPTTLTKYSPKQEIAYALGATLYIPATKDRLYERLNSSPIQDASSVVLDLEDAIGDDEVKDAEDQLLHEVWSIYRSTHSMEHLPFLFIRVRSHKQLKRIAQSLGVALTTITGFVFPKFTTSNGEMYLEGLQEIQATYNTPLYAMPIIETPELIYKESRIEQMTALKELLDRYQSSILNIRIGATDLCGLYGIRRTTNSTIYDIGLMKDFISDLTNFFGRKGDAYTISGPVWEFFQSNRVLKPQIRQTPFRQSYGETGLHLRKDIINEYLDGLIQEVLLDKLNGLTGKTIIHPTHIVPVNALQVVSKEEYLDACNILENRGRNGVTKSPSANKMNEMKPHQYWAEEIIKKSKAYGVFQDGHTYVSLLKEPASV
ncbi:citrate lyase subunit beta [Pontibacillus halophilus JSM 076056 = DSM 19796]|uniref:Citrate lyase subunit beta n=1 Tax=Pontibacillus halophilus JSM 076056 = DSM 19796 TaxID=1385510 RepID=A0A0A5GHJ2_9BACI|nr:HpcH/HpaI aldolase/citrate lyase family protein [Pontibacillus halophilus]KGX90693.1 citrate lyase subunit beta [Pontibacillus halophilus JSM 076056 = DSM 19796]